MARLDFVALYAKGLALVSTGHSVNIAQIAGKD